MPASLALELTSSRGYVLLDRHQFILSAGRMDQCFLYVPFHHCQAALVFPKAEFGSQMTELSAREPRNWLQSLRSTPRTQTVCLPRWTDPLSTYVGTRDLVQCLHQSNQTHVDRRGPIRMYMHVNPCLTCAYARRRHAGRLM